MNKTKTITIRCQDCGGKGYNIIFEGIWKLVTKSDLKQICSTCDGAGQVNKNHYNLFKKEGIWK